MSGWILIIMLYQSGALSLNYPDKAQCDAIAQEIRAKNPDPRHYIACIPQGDTIIRGLHVCYDTQGHMMTCPSGGQQ